MARALPAGPQARRACRPRGGGCPCAPPASASESFSAAQPRAVRRHDFPVATAAGLHLFPSRTEKLSPPAPMVLPLVGRESRSPPISAPPEPKGSGGAFFMPAGQMPPGSAARAGSPSGQGFGGLTPPGYCGAVLRTGCMGGEAHANFGLRCVQVDVGFEGIACRCWCKVLRVSLSDWLASQTRISPPCPFVL